MKNLRQKIGENSNLVSIGLIIGIGLILTWTLIIHGLPSLTNDNAIHSVYYTNFAKQFWGGELYPRWLMGTNAGLGSPTFFYYPPLSYYITSLLSPFFSNDVHGWQQIGISAALALTASGLCLYFWLREITDSFPALIAAIFYLIMPYHFIHDLYQRGAFAEFWAFVWMPLILYFIVRIGKEDKWAFAGLAVSYAALIMTHTITALMFSLIPIAYAFYRTKRERRIKVSGITLTGMLLGIGLSSVYLFPAMFTRDFIPLEEMRTGYLFYENWFVSLHQINGSRMYLQMSAEVLILAFSAYILDRSRLTVIAAKKEFNFWFIIVLLSVFMMTPLSKIVWQIISPLQLIQFPWRFNAILTLAATPLLAFSISSIKRPYSWSFKVFLVIIFLIGAFWVRGIVKTIYPLPILPDDISAKMTETQKLILKQQSAWDFRSRQIPASSLGSDELESLSQKMRQSGDGENNVVIVAGTGTVTSEQWQPRDIILQVDSPTGLRMKIPRFYYPGWEARLSNEQIVSGVDSSEEGLLELSVPEGSYQIHLNLKRNTAEQTGLAASLISGVIVLIISLINIFSLFFSKRK